MNNSRLLLPILAFSLWLLAGSGSTGQERSPVRASEIAGAAGLSASDSARAVENLEADLNKIIALQPEIKSGNVGVKVISLRDGRSLYSLNSAKPLTPASTTKLITTYSALLLFGADYNIPTTALAEQTPKKGVLHGDLFIKGHGDPLLSINDIDALVDKIKAAGITRIEGDIVGDGTYFDDVYERKDYSGDADHVVDLPPISGLAIENNMVTVVVSSSRTPGQLCNVQTFPPSSGFTIMNSATATAAAARKKSKSTGKKSKKKRRSALERTIPEPATVPQIPYGTFGDQEYHIAGNEGANEAGIGITITTEDDGRQIVRVTGSMPANKTVSRRFEIRNPPLVVAGMFYDRLRTRGIAITGTIRTGTTAPKAKSLGEFRRPLVQVLEPVMKNSDNYYAEYVFKMIGGASAKSPKTPTAECSRTAVLQCMENCSVAFDRCVMNDGSGLSRRNLISPDALAATLQAAYRNRKLYNALYPVMSIAGVDGTLRKRMKGTRAEKNVHGKTGTLRNVSALTGYVTTADGDVVGFAAVMNGYNIGGYKSVQDKIAQRMAEFSYKEGIASPTK